MDPLLFLQALRDSYFEKLSHATKRDEILKIIEILIKLSELAIKTSILGDKYVPQNTGLPTLSPSLSPKKPDPPAGQLPE